MTKQQEEDDFQRMLREEGLTGIYEWGCRWILVVLAVIFLAVSILIKL